MHVRQPDNILKKKFPAVCWARSGKLFLFYYECLILMSELEQNIEDNANPDPSQNPK